MIYVLIAIIVVMAIAMLFLGKKSNSETEEKITEEAWPYQLKAKVLTEAEVNFYRVLCNYLNSEEYIVLSKVRLEDIFQVPSKTEGAFGLRNRIKSRHIDFVVCNARGFNPVVGIELDDSSHQSKKAQENDTIKDKIFKDGGLPLVRIPAKKAYTKEEVTTSIKGYISQFENSKTGCESCGTEITDKVKQYCLDNAAKFGSKIYCFECQKKVSKGA